MAAIVPLRHCHLHFGMHFLLGPLGQQAVSQLAWGGCCFLFVLSFCCFWRRGLFFGGAFWEERQLAGPFLGY